MSSPAPLAPDPAPPGRPAPRRRLGRPPAWAAGALGVLTVVAFLAGFATASHPGRDRPSPAPSPVLTFPPLPHAGTGVLTLLQHRPLAIDRPAIPTGSLLVQTSFRLVDAGSVASLYVARSVGGDVCLVAVTADRQFASTCAAPVHVEQVPLQLRFTVATTDPRDRVAVLARLNPDGSADLHAVPKP